MVDETEFDVMDADHESRINDRDSDDEFEYPYNPEEVKKAFKVIKNAMQADCPLERGSYAHGWHVNIAMVCKDAIHDSEIAEGCGWEEVDSVCNDAASRFMKICFDVETKD